MPPPPPPPPPTICVPAIVMPADFTSAAVCTPTVTRPLAPPPPPPPPPLPLLRTGVEQPLVNDKPCIGAPAPPPPPLPPVPAARQSAALSASSCQQSSQDCGPGNAGAAVEAVSAHQQEGLHSPSSLTLGYPPPPGPPTRGLTAVAALQSCTALLSAEPVVDPGHLIEAELLAKIKDALPTFKGQTDYVDIIASASTPPSVIATGAACCLKTQFTFYSA